MRRKNDEIFPDDLTYDDIKTLYLETIGGIEGSIKLTQKVSELMIFRFEQLYRSGAITENAYSMMKDFNEAVSKETPFLHKIFYG